MVSSKSEYEAKLITHFRSDSSSKIYKYIRSVTGQNAIPNSVYLDSATADSDLEKSSLFNSFFHSVFTNSSFYLPPVSLLHEPQSVLDDFLITESEVFQVLSSLDPSKAMGCDGIGPRLLKHCALAVYQPFHNLFCLSRSQHYIPVEWRTHMVRPIFKSGPG